MIPTFTVVFGQHKPSEAVLSTYYHDGLELSALATTTDSQVVITDQQWRTRRYILECYLMRMMVCEFIYIEFLGGVGAFARPDLTRNVVLASHTNEMR